MAERPILFSGPMVRAILEGRKTQTRRVVKPQPVRDAYNGSHGDLVMWEGRIERLQIDPKDERRATTVPVACPYGSPGDTLWVRETLGVTWQGDCEYMADRKEVSDPRAHALCERYGDRYHFSEVRKVPSIFMPRWASRFSLLVKRVRVERLQDISEADIVAEGLTVDIASKLTGIPWSSLPTLHDGWAAAWDTINGKRAPWASNPWVWVVEFERVKEAANA